VTVCLVFPANVTLSVLKYLVYQETEVTAETVTCHLLSTQLELSGVYSTCESSNI